MNKKDLTTLKRHFKLDSNYLKLNRLYMVYLKKDNREIVHKEHISPDMKDDAEKEIYLSNFKKLLSGGLNTKVFEMSFDDEISEDSGQELCLGLLNSSHEAFPECCDKFIEMMAEYYNYENDVVISFARGKYNKPAGKKSRKGEEESLEGFDETTYGFKFIMCSVNKVDSAKRNIYYDASTRTLEMSSSLNKTISFPSPIDGFMFPAFVDNSADVNKLVYYTSKANLRNESLVSDVLHCRYEPTAKEEQEKFEEIIKEVNGEKIKPEIMRDIYALIANKLESEVEPDDSVTLDSHEIRDIFQECGIQNMDKFDEIISRDGDDEFEFKAASIVPESSKAVKITAGSTEISIIPDELGAVRQIIDSRGRKCLQIELSEDATFGSFILETEKN